MQKSDCEIRYLQRGKKKLWVKEMKRSTFRRSLGLKSENRELAREFQSSLRESMVEIVRMLKGMNQQWSAGRSNSNCAEGSHSANEGVSANPPTKTFRAKFLQKGGENQQEEEQQIPPNSNDEMARYHADYSL